MPERATRRTAATRRAEGRQAARRQGGDRSALTRSTEDALASVRAYLQAAGYRALPGRCWPPRVIGVFANDESDQVVLLRNRFGCLELRPLDVQPGASLAIPVRR